MGVGNILLIILGILFSLVLFLMLLTRDEESKQMKLLVISCFSVLGLILILGTMDVIALVKADDYVETQKTVSEIHQLEAFSQYETTTSSAEGSFFLVCGKYSSSSENQIRLVYFEEVEENLYKRKTINVDESNFYISYIDDEETPTIEYKKDYIVCEHSEPTSYTKFFFKNKFKDGVHLDSEKIIFHIPRDAVKYENAIDK